MRPNKVGYFLTLFFFLGGIGFWIAMPEVGIGQIWTAVATFLGLLFIWMNKKADEDDHDLGD